MEYRIISLPVSSSVMFILYSLMMPFLNTMGGGDQVRKIEDELRAVTFNCCGGPVGAEKQSDGVEGIYKSK